ncbi:MAG: hypothetical protein QM730_05740 [Anaerolineales bacterium]
MFTKQKGLNAREQKKQIAHTVKRFLTSLITLLIIALLILIFGVGKSWWATWILVHRTQIEGIMLLAIISLLLASPIIIEASSNPRRLSGPGKNPENPNWPQ